jgi:hypothetical protein
MEESRAGGFLASINEKLADQEWYQQAKAKWDELDPQSRTNALLGAAAGVVLLLLLIVGSFVAKAHGLRSELAEKLELLEALQSGGDELKRLKDSNSAGAAGAASTAPWSAYLEGMAASSGVDKASLTLSNEKPGKSSEQGKEALIDLAVKHVSIRQVVRLAYQLETGARPVKIRNLLVDTKADPTGYMDATYSLSGFALITEKK